MYKECSKVVRRAGQGEEHWSMLLKDSTEKEKRKAAVKVVCLLVLSALPQFLNTSSWEQISPLKQVLVEHFFFMEQFVSVYGIWLSFASEKIAWYQERFSHGLWSNIHVCPHLFIFGMLFQNCLVERISTLPD